MSTTWSETPPVAPPQIDADPCLTWESAHFDGAASRTLPPADAGPTYAPPTYGATPLHGYGAPTPPPQPPRTSPPTTRGGGARAAFVIVALLAFLSAGFAARGLLDDRIVTPNPVAASATPTSAAPAVTTPLVSGSDDEPVAAVASALGPSVVVIKTADGLGSGVVYDSSGLILTNAHVVGTSKGVTVTLGDGQSVDGTVLGRDTTTDIAVVKVDVGKDLPAARLATAPATVGQLAVAVGSPFGLDHTVTAGVVSAVNRPVDNQSGVVASMIQTDAPINPGNSGGALANRHGEVIGINTMIFSQSGENNGIGFAIPIDTAKSVADKITGGDSLARAYLGTSTTQPTDGTPGALIAKVASGSPAEQAGLQNGDIVTSIDATPVKQSGDLAAAISTKNPGDHIKVTVQRGGNEVTVDVTLGTRPGTR